MKRLITTLGLSALIFIILSPIAIADTQSTAEMICNDGTREGEALESCIQEQVADMEDGADYETTARAICEDGERSQAELDSCIEEQVADMEDGAEQGSSDDYDSCVSNQIQQQQDQGEEIDVETAESQCAEQYPDEAGPQNMPASSSNSVSTKPVMPTIPKPALLPGPNEGSGAKDVQQYFRNKAIPNFTAGFIGLISGMAIIALVWSGIRFISAGGEEEAITSAKKTATWAIAGLAIAILSYAIVSIITSIQYPNETTPSGTPAEEESVIYKNN